MLSWATSFFVAAIVAAVFGFAAAAGLAAALAKFLFGLFLLLFVATTLGALQPAPIIRSHDDGH